MKKVFINIFLKDYIFYEIWIWFYWELNKELKKNVKVIVNVFYVWVYRWVIIMYKDC